MPIQLDGTTGISTTGNIISNGTITATNIALNNINTVGNISAAGNITAGGSLTVGSFAATTLSASGNVTGGNLITAAAVSAASVSASGNITGSYFLGNGSQLTGIDATSIQNGTSNVRVVSSGGNVTVGIGGTGNVAVFATTGEYVTGEISASGNVTGGNIITAAAVGAASVSASGNVTGGNVLTAGVMSAGGNVTGGNLVTAGNIFAPAIIANASVYDTRVELNSTAGIVAITSAGNSTQFTPSGVINLSGASAIKGGTFSGSYLTLGTSQTDLAQDRGGNVTVQVGTGGTIASTWTFTNSGNLLAPGAVSAVGNITGGNILGGANVNATTHTGTTVSVSGNVTGGNLITAAAVNAASVSASGNITGGNVIVGNLVFSTDTISSQDGTITIDPAAVGVTGLVIIQGNLQVNGNTTTINSNVVSTNDLTYNLANNAINSAAANGGGIEVGPIGSPYITWLYDSTANVFTSSGGVSATGNITGSYFLGNGSQLTGIDATSIQNGTSNVRVVSSGGNVTVSVGGTSNVAVFDSTGEYVTGLISATGNITGGNLSGTSIVGTLTTATQTNITSVGTLGSLAVTGNITGGNISGNLLVPGANSQVVFNDNGVANAVSGLSFNKGTSALSVTGNIRGGNISVTGNVTANNVVLGFGTISAGNVTTFGLSLLGNVITDINSTSAITTTANISGGNLITAGLISATGAITGAGITGTSLTVSTGNISGGNINNNNATGVGNIGTATVGFNTVFAKATSAQYADLAENYAADADYAPGTVLVFGGSQEVTLSDTASDHKIAGVVSTNPAHLMNSGLDCQYPVAIALTGRTPTRVTGLINKGDLMVSAGNGAAMACATPVVGTVIGKALENFDGDSGVIEVVVGVR